MIKIDELIISQDGLRHPDQINQMVKFVQDGGFYSKDALDNYQFKYPDERDELIAISWFPDDKYYIHNGHHRLVSIYLGGRDFIRNDEYNVTKWTYEQYKNPNFELGFWTPFDPETEVRRADFGNYRKIIKDIIEKSYMNQEQLTKFIHANAHQYKVPRPAHHIKHLVQ